MKIPDELMLGYQVLDAVLALPNPELTDEERQTLEAAK